MKHSEDGVEYVNRLTEIEHKLDVVGHITCERDRKRALLRGLRTEFTIVKTVLTVIETGIEGAISKLVLE